MVGSRPGSGRALASALIASRVARETRPGVDPYGDARTSPGSADRPSTRSAPGHAWRPDTLPLILARNESVGLASSSRSSVSPLGSRRARRGDCLGGANHRLSSASSQLVAKRRSNPTAIRGGRERIRSPTVADSSAARPKPSPFLKRGCRRRASRRHDRRVDPPQRQTVQTVGARAPSQRMVLVPVVAAYLSASPTPKRQVCNLASCHPVLVEVGVQPLSRCPRPMRLSALSGSLPSENSAKSRFGTT